MTVFIDPRVSKPAADLAAQVRRETVEECAKICDSMHRDEYGNGQLDEAASLIRARFGEGEEG